MRASANANREHFIELLKLETVKLNHANKTHTHIHTVAHVCAYTCVQAVFILDKREKKEENRNYFVVKDVIVNVYKVKTE